MITLMNTIIRSSLFRPQILVRHHTGYIPFEGRLGDFDVEYLRILKQLRLIHLQPVKKIHISFDPFYPRIRTVRNVMHFFSKDKIRFTNLKCALKTEIKSDGSEPLMKVELNNGHTLLFKLGTLSIEESLFQFNKHVLPLVVEEKEVTESKGAKASRKKKK